FTTACAGFTKDEIIDIASDVATDLIEDALAESDEQPTEEIPFEESEYDYTSLVVEGEYYYDVERVVLYIHTFGELPDNYVTKNEARDLGWEGGSVEPYLEGAAIGGDYFGNREELLPKADGREYTECDIDTLGYGSRGARRLVFSNDGLYFYTDDHYESFTELVVENGEVIWK
ncbi:MAG: hypothetical protein IJO77_03650, partial [Oscillospiraceae bacterium]|nr:hypothetical protein [Oscillospiraceae bacterium]